MSNRDLMTEEAAAFAYLNALLLRKMIRVGNLGAQECRDVLKHMEDHFDDQRASGARNICEYLSDSLSVTMPGERREIQGGKSDERESTIVRAMQSLSRAI